MMEKDEKPNFFDTFEEYKQKRNNSRQIAYENKVCRKLITRMFEKGSEDKTYWSKRLEASSEPLAELQELVNPFCLSTSRLQQFSINDLLGSTTKVAQLPLWQAFAEKIALCGNSKQITAMVFYNSVISQDMVIHTGLNTQMPKGYFRLMRTSTSGDGGVIIDTLDGFLELITGN